MLKSDYLGSISGLSLTSHIIFESITSWNWMLMLVRMATIKKYTNNKCWRGCGEKGSLLSCGWEYKLIWRTVWRLLKKIGIKLLYDPTILLPGIYPEETISEKDTWTPKFITALFTIARTWKQPSCPLTDEWIKKLWYIYTIEYYSAIKKSAFDSVLISWINLEPFIQSKVSQKDNYVWTHTYRI